MLLSVPATMSMSLFSTLPRQMTGFCSRWSAIEAGGELLGPGGCRWSPAGGAETHR